MHVTRTPTTARVPCDTYPLLEITRPYVAVLSVLADVGNSPFTKAGEDGFELTPEGMELAIQAGRLARQSYNELQRMGADGEAEDFEDLLWDVKGDIAFLAMGLDTHVGQDREHGDVRPRDLQGSL